MTPTDITEFNALTEKFNSFIHSLGFEPAQHAVHDESPFDRAYARLNRACAEYTKDPADPAKSKSVLNALDNYQTAFVLLTARIESLAEQIDAVDFEGTPIGEKFNAAFNARE